MNATPTQIRLFAALLGLALVAVVAGRAIIGARTELERASSYRQEGKPTRAIEHYRRALRWSFPFDPATDEAIAGLESIARVSESAGDTSTALQAWRSVVGGLAASRAMYSGPQPSEEKAKDEIARLLASQGGAPIDAGLDEKQLRAEHRRLLARQAKPDPFWGTWLLLGFAVWVTSLVLVIHRGFDFGGRPHWPAARAPLYAALAGFVSFLLGSLFA